MFKRLSALLLAILMVCTLMPMVSAEDDGYNDTTMDWGAHTTHVYDDCADLSCNVCGALRVSDHVYTAVETTPPSCSAEGVRTYTCSVCSHSYTESIDLLNHTWSDATCAAPKTCTVCGATEGNPLDHVYDNACDADCNACGAIRQVGDHVYTYPCDSSCDVCGATRDASHDWMDATCTQPRICRVCGSEDGVALDHVYDNLKFDDDKHWWECDCGAEELPYRVSHGYTRTYDETQHWLECGDCGYRVDEKIHQYDNACDAECTVCGAIREVGEHQYDNACDAACNECGAERTVAGHDYKKVVVTKATTTKDGKYKNVCEICGYTASKQPTVYKASKVALSKTSYTYNGKVQKPTVIVKDSSGKTISTAHYTVTYPSGMKNAGTYSVKVTFKGNYSGTKTLTYKIKGIDVSKCKITLSSTSYTYTGGVKKPTVTVKN
ncbi:MAG: hypothetical protein IIX28_05585, partial [Clostridia bacterium]|nr:hypothetical protein [Clostridia bacterium]